MVHYFLQVSPDTVAMATNKGKLALHFAAGDGHEALTSILLRLYPQGAAWPSSKGKLPLHFCARWGYVDIAHDLLRIYPDAVRTLDWDGSLPLHDAAREGQCRMSRYLIERFPTALQTANLRGEIPLFAAVRSAKVDLVALMIQAWPKGGQHILRTLSADDNVTNWKWDIVELLLRGAVNNLEGCKLLEGREPPTVRLTDDMQPAAMISSSTEEWKAQKKMKKDRQSENDQQSPLVDARRQWTPLTAVAPPFASLSTTYPFTPRSPTAPSFAFMPVRSKSPILTSGDCNGDSKKKHARKRMRQSRAHVDSPSNDYVRKFIALHAAFECKAACHVIEHVLREHSKDVVMKDELGRLPLHWAVTHCHNQDAVATTLVLKNRAILTPEAACTEDSTGKLPLHLAIASRADVRVICALLEAYPAAGVEPCRTKDCFHAKTPVHMATYYDCDLSTVFELLRVDPSFVSRH